LLYAEVAGKKFMVLYDKLAYLVCFPVFLKESAVSTSERERLVTDVFEYMRDRLVCGLAELLKEDKTFRAEIVGGKILTPAEALAPVIQTFKEKIPASSSPEELVEKLIDTMCLCLHGYSRLFVIKNCEMWKTGLEMLAQMQKFMPGTIAGSVSGTLSVRDSGSFESSSTRLTLLQGYAACIPLISAEMAACLNMQGDDGGIAFTKAGVLLNQSSIPKEYGRDAFTFIEGMAKGGISDNLGPSLDSLLITALSIMGYQALKETA